MNHPPACLFPTTTVIIDDDHDFMNSVRKRLTNGKTIIKTFDNPTSASTFLKDSLDKQCLMETCFSISPSDYSYENMNIEIKFPKIMELSLNPQRFQQITCVIVDYCMPGMNGLQFLAKFPDKKLKKILLTGHADATVAIEAVNNGLIDYYVKKHDPEMGVKLKGLITKIQLSYFEELTAFIKNSLPIVRENDEVKKSYFSIIEKILAGNDINEFYLSDVNGSYTFLNEPKRIDLFIKSRDQLHSEAELMMDTIKDQTTLNSLKNFSVMMASEKLLKTEALSSKKTFFYSILES